MTVHHVRAAGETQSSEEKEGGQGVMRAVQSRERCARVPESNAARPGGERRLGVRLLLCWWDHGQSRPRIG